jgi:glycine/D-amino acid oxidase-like deaminating enzyme
MGPLAGSLAAQVALGLPPAIDLAPFALRPLVWPEASWRRVPHRSSPLLVTS